MYAVWCLRCELQMPRAGFPDAENNPVSRIFWGISAVRGGISLFRFEKGSACQAILHELKYRGNAKAGMYLGRLLGHELTASAFFDCDLMVPVPLHKKKLKQRGYNQSELIAGGASEITGIPVLPDLLRRTEYQHSQTTMNRQERFENMARAFSCSSSAPNLHLKKILIIDDTITTGATMEACSTVLLQNFQCSIYIATVSYA